ncbi:MAG: hypothetical protein H0T66_19575 [Geodermatophilaceae bacterium]|nr:hypothetical protein [Geodermatophilaceae bacterium]
MAERRRAPALVVADDGRTVTVVPGGPEPERGPTGTPMVTLLGAPASASLNVGVRWWPAEDELHRLLAAEAKRRKVDPALFRVAADSLSGVRTALHLRTGGEERELVAAGSSGTPPYSTVLSVQLTGAAVEAVRRALFGQAGVLTVQCRAESAAAGCISGDADVSEWTRPAPDVHVVMIAPHQ